MLAIRCFKGVSEIYLYPEVAFISSNLFYDHEEQNKQSIRYTYKSTYNKHIIYNKYIYVHTNVYSRY